MSVSRIAAVSAHFDSAALNYQLRSTKGLWCWLRARETAELARMWGDVTNAEALDLGAGSGFYGRRLLAAGASRVVAVDCSKRMLAQLPAAIEPIHADAASLNMNERFALVVCAGVIEFVAEPIALLQAAKRHLTNEGAVVVLVPTSNIFGRIYRYSHRKNGLDVALSDETALQEIAGKAELAIEKIVHVFPFALVARLTPLH